jgi:hypothetical protein
VWGLSGFENLYQTQLPDYPPAQILVFSILSRVILSETIFLFLICCTTVTLGGLIWGTVKDTLRYPILSTVFFTFTSAPLIYAIDRGGTDMVLFPLVVLAILFHSDGRINQGKALIAISTSLKIIPGIYTLIYIERGKSVRKIVSVIVTAIIVNLIAALMLPEKGISEIWLYTKHLIGRSSGSSVTNAYDVFNNSLWASFRGIYLGFLNFGIDLENYLVSTWLVANLLLLFFSLYWCFFQSRVDASKFFIANCLLLLVPTLAPNYRLLFLYPSLWYLSNAFVITNKKLSKTFVVASSFLLSVSPVYYFGSTGINIGQAVKPVLILLLLLIVFFSDGNLKEKKLDQNNNEEAVDR